jgi:glycosyltransferase involved in cell wall biosynthesis
MMPSAADAGSTVECPTDRSDGPDSQLRVLQVAASVAPQDGGPSVAIMAINKALRNQGIASTVCSTDADGRHGRLPASERARLREAANVRLFRVHWPRRLKASIGMTLSLFALTRSAHVVHIHYLHAWSSFVATLYCRMLRRPYVLQPHGSLEPYHLAKSPRVKALFELISGTLRHADALVLATATESTHITSVPQSRKLVVPLGAPQVTPVRRSSGTKDSVILFLGRLAPKKRADVLLHAWPQVIEEFPTARLHIVGPDTDGLLDQYKVLVASLGLQESVVFPGLLLDKDKVEAFANATIFALPSENESFGIAVAEALSAGLPVLLSKYVAIAEEVAAAGAGVIVRSLQPEEWAHAVIGLLHDNAGRTTMSTAARRLASERYSWDEVGRRLERFYRGILGQTTIR